jgi:hypothetical protein
MPLEISLRAFADVAQEAEAREILDAILRHFSSHELLATATNQYWKVPQWYEVFVRLRAYDTNEAPIALLQRLSGVLGTAWTLKHMDEDADALWRREDGGSFIDSRVTWANLQCFVVES